MKDDKQYDIAIVGGGLAGLTMAHAAARHGREIALISPVMAEADGRTTALLADSIDYLEQIGVWQQALPQAAIMSYMRIIDNTKRLIHAPEITFKSVEIGLDCFGYNILNSKLSKVLTTGLKKLPNVTVLENRIEGFDETADGVEIALDSGTKLQAQIIIGADGRGSTTRQMANHGKGIGTRQWQYPQIAIVLNFSHNLPHNNTSTEFHTPSGPFTIVPLTANTSSLVWVVKPEMAEQLLEQDKNLLGREIEEQMHSILGKTEIISAVQSFPLSGMTADTMASNRVFLVGDAAHVLPPIGAQGFNLGIRDIRALDKLIGASIDNPALMAERYNQQRKSDVRARTISVDLFNRSLLSDFLPVQAMRSGSLAALNQWSSVRKLMMREGVSPGMGFKAITEGLQDIGKWFQPPKKHS